MVAGWLFACLTFPDLVAPPVALNHGGMVLQVFGSVLAANWLDL
jgi:hypothetical protein